MLTESQIKRLENVESIANKIQQEGGRPIFYYGQILSKAVEELLAAIENNQNISESAEYLREINSLYNSNPAWTRKDD